MKLVDSHCHLDDQQFDADREETIERARAAGVEAMMAIGTWIGLRYFAAKDAGWPSAGLIVSLAINLGFLMLCWSAIAMAIGCASL